MRSTSDLLKKKPPQVKPTQLTPFEKLRSLLQPIQRLSQWLPISLILLFAATLYLYQLNTESLWVDELLSIHRAKNLDYALRDPRPLSYILLRVWMVFGSSDAWLRGLSILFGLGTVFLTYILGRRLITTPVGLIAALLVALSPLFINHAQEIRMYTQSTCLGLLGTLVLVAALNRPTTAAVYGWAGLRFLALITTPLNLFLLLPDCVIIAWRFREKRNLWFPFLQGLLLMGLAWAAFAIPLLIVSIPKFMGGVVVPGATEPAQNIVLNRPGIFEVIFQLSRFTAWPFGRPNSDTIYHFYQLHAVVFLAVFGAAFLNHQRSLEIRWLTTWGILPLIPLFLVSQISRNLWVDRYLIFVAPYMMILLATGLMQLWQRWRIAAVIVTVVALIGTAGGFKRYYTVLDREDWRGLVQSIEAQEQPNDVIVWSVNQQIPVALNHYYQGNSRIEIIPELPADSLEKDQAKIEAWLANLPVNQSTLWLVHLPTSPLFHTLLAEKFEIKSHQNMKKFEVFQLRAKSSSLD